MARSTTRSLAGKAASAARKAMSRRTSGSGAARTATKASSKKAAPAKKASPTTKAAPATTKAAPAKKAASKKAAPAEKAAAKKAAPKKAAPAKKAAAKQTAKKAAPAKKAGAKKAAPASKAATKNAPPAKKAAAKKGAAKKAPPAKQAPPAKKSQPAKQAPAKQAPARARTGAVNPAKLPVLPREKPWTKAEINEVISDLNDDRARVVRTLTAQEAELAGLMRDAGDGAGHDQADMGATSFERDQELTVVNNEREKLAQIDRALGRIADGTYGVCESCGNPIGKGRSMAFPRATLCLTCKQREERR
jgi:RNA polymerase-binding protein DksA